MTAADSAVVQSGTNTIRTWMVRRQANGKTVSRADLLARIRTLWPDISDPEVDQIISKVLP